jgi:hypothetical protein
LNADHPANRVPFARRSTPALPATVSLMRAMRSRFWLEA